MALTSMRVPIHNPPAWWPVILRLPEICGTMVCPAGTYCVSSGGTHACVYGPDAPEGPRLASASIEHARTWPFGAKATPVLRLPDASPERIARLGAVPRPPSASPASPTTQLFATNPDPRAQLQALTGYQGMALDDLAAGRIPVPPIPTPDTWGYADYQDGSHTRLPPDWAGWAFTDRPTPETTPNPPDPTDGPGAPYPQGAPLPPIHDCVAERAASPTAPCIFADELDLGHLSGLPPHSLLLRRALYDERIPGTRFRAQVCLCDIAAGSERLLADRLFGRLPAARTYLEGSFYDGGTRQTRRENPFSWLLGAAALGVGGYVGYRVLCDPRTETDVETTETGEIRRTLVYEGCFQPRPWRAELKVIVKKPVIQPPVETIRHFDTEDEAIAFLYGDDAVTRPAT